MRARTWNWLLAFAALSTGCQATTDSSTDESSPDDGEPGAPVSADAPRPPPPSGAAAQVALTQVPAELYRRALQHVFASARDGVHPTWAGARIGDAVRPIHRPDISGPAYYEFRVVNAANATVGFVVVSTGSHDFPIAHWGTTDTTPTDRLIAAAGESTIGKFHKIDAIHYVAESAEGALLASTTDTFTTAPLPAVDKGPIHEESYYASATPDAAGNWDPNAGVQARKERRQPLPQTTLAAAAEKSGVQPVTAATDLVFKLNGTGDADIYVKKGSPPTLNSFDCRPYTASSTEECRVSAQPGDQVYWMVRGYSATSDVWMTVHEQVLPQTTLAQHQQQAGSYTASAAGELVLDLAGTGDADLYVKKGQAPTLASFDCRPYEGDATETCRVQVAAGDTVYWMVDGYSATSTVTLTALDKQDRPEGQAVSWSQLRANFASLTARRLARLATSAAREWETRSSLLEFGEGVLPGMIIEYPLLFDDGALSLTGDTSAVSSSGIVELPAGGKVARVQIASTALNGGNFTIHLSYPAEGEDELMMKQREEPGDVDPGDVPPHNGGGSNDAWTPKILCSVAGPDDIMYDQIPASTGVNNKGFWSGCGPTAWTIVSAWFSNQAWAGNRNWAERGIFRENGSVNGPFLQAPMTQDPNFLGTESQIMMIFNNLMGTHNSNGEGATSTSRMDDAADYSKPRAPLDVDADIYGFDRTGTATDHLCKSRVPTILALDVPGGKHAPVAFRLAENVTIVKHTNSGWGLQPHSRGFLLNMGWGGGLTAGEWYPTDTDLAATFQSAGTGPGFIPNDCSTRTDTQDRICCHRPWICYGND